MRLFNTEGPVVAEDHGCIPPLERVNVDEVPELIRREEPIGEHTVTGWGM